MSGTSESKVIEGHIDAKGLRLGVVVSRFNAFITEKLLEGLSMRWSETVVMPKM